MGAPINFVKKREVLDYVRNEIKEYRAGKKDWLSRNSEIALRFGIGRTSVSKYLNGLTPKQRYFRLYANNSKTPQTKRKRFLRLAKRKPYTSILEIAIMVGIPESSAYYILPEKIKQYRRDQKKAKKKEKVSEHKHSPKIAPKDRRALVELVKEEFQICESGELERFTTSHELAELVGHVTEAAIRYHLRKHLSKREQELRNLVIRYGNNPKAMKKAKLVYEAAQELTDRVN